MHFWLEVFKITIPALVTIGMVFLGRYFERQRENENKIRERKIAVYEKFVINTLEHIGKFPNLSQTKKAKMQEELEAKYEQFHRELLFRGSDKIIKEYNNWRCGLTKDSGSLLGFEKLLFAFRKDVGHNNKGLKESDLFKLLLNPDEFDDKGKPINKEIFKKPLNNNLNT